MLRYVYTYDLRKKEIKTGDHRSYRKNGGRSKSKNWRQNTVLSRSRTLKKLLCRYDSVTNIGNAFIYGLQKYDLKHGLCVYIKRVVSKVSFTCKQHFLSRS